MKTIIEHWQSILAVGTAIIGFIFGYNKKRTDSISDIQQVYRGLIKDVEQRVETMSEQMKLNNIKMEENNAKMSNMEGRINELHKENLQLKKENSKLRNEINKLKRK